MKTSDYVIWMGCGAVVAYALYAAVSVFKVWLS